MIWQWNVFAAKPQSVMNSFFISVGRLSGSFSGNVTSRAVKEVLVFEQKFRTFDPKPNDDTVLPFAVSTSGNKLMSAEYVFANAFLFL